MAMRVLSVFQHCSSERSDWSGIGMGECLVFYGTGC